jgi:hypothetical protein
MLETVQLQGIQLKCGSPRNKQMEHNDKSEIMLNNLLSKNFQLENAYS